VVLEAIREKDPSRLQDLTGRAEAELAEQGGKLGRVPSQADIVAEAMRPGHRRARLVRIELPGMQVEHDRLSFPYVHAPNSAAHQFQRQQPEVAAAADREIHAEHTR